ncbi:MULTISPECIES: nitrite/sulfite reductase domain-containing protein [Desulfobacula]|uniref:Sulfite reductase, assimilatory type n=2 Tax=Desulfobacula TaxID=28222 RepID=K0NHT4_DESTT|nr:MULTISPECIES: NAD(P)/FAD-dependent oxidoreductase [Desulfobacula]CCK78532.1 sulfite reductase, assimilatory type [Desulfobacula toluolica Tol2]SDU52328.1 Nitrite/Sulfite reductase ferredoxin-like half domain-containing protein [Desulfobacula phenolica]
MLKLGEKGAIPQKDKKTYAIAPHIPCGVVTPDLLRKIADVSEKYNAQAVKITGATRIAIVGLKEEDIDSAWEELGLDKGAAVGLCVRSIRSCPGNTFCTIGKQDSLGLGMKLDKKYHGFKLPGKFKMAVSGCHLSCAESWVRDIGLIGKKDGWTLTIGGNVGAHPRIGDVLLEGLDDQGAMDAIDKVVAHYQENAKPGERLGKMIDRLGLDGFKAAVA